jgi:hypothetical protein
VETNYLTLWFYLSLAGAGLIVYGAICYTLTANILDVAIALFGVLVSVISYLVLKDGLTKEHTIATESGNAGPTANASSR